MLPQRHPEEMAGGLLRSDHWADRTTSTLQGAPRKHCLAQNSVPAKLSFHDGGTVMTFPRQALEEFTTQRLPKELNMEKLGKEGH